LRLVIKYIGSKRQRLPRILALGGEVGHLHHTESLFVTGPDAKESVRTGVVQEEAEVA